MALDWTGAVFMNVLEASLRICAVAAAVSAILFVCRIRSGGICHAAWRAVLGTMLLMPLLPAVLPSISVPMPVAQYGLDRSPFVLDNTGAVPVVENQQQVAQTTTMPAVASPAARSSERHSVLPAILLVSYGIGTFVLFLRLLLGWRAIRRIECVRVSIPGAIDSIFESRLVAVPMTVGVMSPRIILPVEWRAWPDDKLRAILAHELAHIHRRDPLVLFLARVNCCLFWFHPVAWWLKRQLAITAESACDEAGIRETGSHRRYAEILLELSDTMRRHGNRFSWQGIGMRGTGPMSQRIERILCSKTQRKVSAIGKGIVAFGCVAAIFLPVACRPAPAPLQEDPEYREQQNAAKDRADFYNSAGHMSAADVAALEQDLKTNPEDLVARRKLLVFYGLEFTANTAARRPHILFIIEHFPESEIAGSWETRIYPTSRDPSPDPDGYAEARKLWLAQTDKPGVSAQVLSNAAYFFEAADKPLAEHMLLRAQMIDPSGRWSSRIGRLYALSIVGSNASTPLNVVRSISVDDAQSPYALEIRRKLSESTDEALLTSAGEFLVYSTSQAKGLSFDPVALGRSYLERALELNPQATRVRGILYSLQIGQRNRRLFQLLQNTPKEAQYQVVSALPDAERFEYLPELTYLAYAEGEHLGYTQKNPVTAKAAWDRSRKYAEDLLALAEGFQNSPNYATAIYIGNLSLGTTAMREGNQKQAVRYMRAAAKAPISDELAYSVDGFLRKLLRELLKYGERESVIEFLETVAAIKVRERDELLASAAAIRNGRMPFWYQASMSK